MQLESPQKPIVQAMLIADHVYQDVATKKYVIAGIFNQINFQRKESLEQEHGPNIVPGGVNAGSPFLYLSMVELNGIYEFVLRYSSLKTDQSLFQTEFRVECKQPLAVIELAFGLPPLPAFAEDTFALELLWKDESIASVRVIVRERHTKGNEDVDERKSDE